MKSIRSALKSALCLSILSAAPGLVENVLAQNTRDAADQTPRFILDTVVVTAARVETPLRQVSSSISVITAADMERSGRHTVADVLRDVGGLSVTQSGGAGKNASVFLRGAESAYTLFLIDGVEVNDPMSPGRSYSPAHLTVDQVERIEVLYGSQSTLYGSDAIAGVVNIITKRGEGKPKLGASIEGGALGTFQSRAGLSGGTKDYQYAIDGSFLNTRGISSNALGNMEEDGYRNTTLAGRFGATPSKGASVDLTFRYTDGRADIDNGTGPNGDDPNRLNTSRHLFVRPSATVELWSQRWKQTLGYSLVDHRREDDNPVDENQEMASNSTYDARLHKVDWQNTLALAEGNTVVFGAEIESEQGESESKGRFPGKFDRRTERMSGVYLQELLQYGNSLFATVGVRADHHSRFGAKVTYSIAPNAYFEGSGTRIKGAFGTGYKAPSLFQLYSSFGDSTLQAGTSKSWEAGIEQYLAGQRFSAGVTWFDNTFDNMVGWDSETSSYKNVFKATSRGMELTGRYTGIAGTSLRAYYTLTDSKDHESDEQLLRRPKHSGGIVLDQRVRPGISLNLSFRFSGERRDNDFSTWPATPVTLDGYGIVNVAANWKITPNIQVFGRIDNLFDAEYEEILGYGTVGVTGYVGVRVGSSGN